MNDNKNHNEIAFYIGLIEKGFNFVDHIADMTYQQISFLSKGYEIYNEELNKDDKKASTKRVQGMKRNGQNLRRG